MMGRFLEGRVENVLLVLASLKAMATCAALSSKMVMSGSDSTSLTPDMPLAERAHAFNVNKNALSNLFLPQRSTLRPLGDTLGCSVVVSLTAAKFKKIANTQLYSNVILTAITYHGSNGHVIKDSVDMGN